MVIKPKCIKCGKENEYLDDRGLCSKCTVELAAYYLLYGRYYNACKEK